MHSAPWPGAQRAGWEPTQAVFRTFGRDFRFHRVQTLFENPHNIGGNIDGLTAQEASTLPPFFQEGAYFRVAQALEQGTLVLVPDNPPLSALDLGAPGSPWLGPPEAAGSDGPGVERVWALNWIREIVGRGAAIERRRAAILLALAALTLAGRRAGRAVRAVFRTSALPLREWLRG